MDTAWLERTDLDERIWREELDEFVPRQVFDAHTHIWRWDFYLAADKETGSYRNFVRPEFEHSDYALLDAVDAALMPGREVRRLAFPFPFQPPCDFESSNRFIVQQTRSNPGSAALMLVQPSMTADELNAWFEAGCVGLKPYRFYSSTGDAVTCRITDFLPEFQLEVASQRGAIVMLHLSMPNGIADERNLADLERLGRSYPGIQWILAHCARSYSHWPIEEAGARLAALPNTWFDTSSVCESEAIAALIRSVGIGRVMYGSDDIPVGVLRGKYVSFGRAWAYLSEANQSLNLSHCDPRMTFTRYEQLRAMRRAAISVGLTGQEIADLFHDNARRLLSLVATNTDQRAVSSSDRDQIRVIDGATAPGPNAGDAR
ncbi:MAG: amidohydrolase family protein [Planctomycetales bacterium]|nr:amidohydrolase family protein [Planctomycetales bacterium]